MKRIVVLDTETTGLDPKSGHRIIEIGCIEIIDRKPTKNHYHQYINPNREVEQSAFAVHGLSNSFLADKPLFKNIAAEFLEFIKGSEVVIHNAPFDVGFINEEFKLLKSNYKKVELYCKITDSLVLARSMHMGQRNSLDALCKRYEIDNTQRVLHGALLDAELLAEVYLKLTGGQTAMTFSIQNDEVNQDRSESLVNTQKKNFKVIKASDEELISHQEKLAEITKISGKNISW